MEKKTTPWYCVRAANAFSERKKRERKKKGKPLYPSKTIRTNDNAVYTESREYEVVINAAYQLKMIFV